MNSSDESQSFDDPSLKRVCRASWGHEKCPLALLSRLRGSASQTGQSVQPQSSQPMRLNQPVWFNPLFGLGAAAAVLIVVGLFVSPFEGRSNVASASFLDPQLTQSILAVHDKCCDKNGKHQVSNDTAGKVSETGYALHKRLGTPVLATAMPERGWTFRGGTVCPVKGVPAAHLIFKQGPASVSMFSLPRAASSSSYAYAGPYDSNPDDRHVLAGFVDSRGAFCLVASGDSRITRARLAAMRDRIQTGVVMSASPLPPAIYAQRELLQSRR
jgi:hypothetical protein